MRTSSGVRLKNVLKIAGAYIAWVIGSGFATGQEVLQFFSGYGYWSYAVVAINLVGFMLFGYLLMRTGFENRHDPGFDHFRYYCGRKLGVGYSWLITVTLLLLIPVLISGGGATLREYYGIPKPVGSALLAAAVLAVYLIGFEKMVGIVSRIGPVIILFSLTVGVVSVLRGRGSWGEIPAYEAQLRLYRAAPTWWLSGILYLGLNFFPSSTYFTQLGASAQSEKDLRYGAICGALLLILCILIMSTAIMLNGSSAAGLEIPVLHLARNISALFATVFSVTLSLGIFSSCSVMLWSVCRNLSAKTHRSRLTAVAVVVFGYVVSLFPFGALVGTLYPLIGYIGLVYLACVLRRGLGRKKPT